MNPVPDHLVKQYGSSNSSNSKLSANSDISESTTVQNVEAEERQRAILIEWMNGILPNLNLPVKASSEELRACLLDGTVLLQILNKTRPGCIHEGCSSDKLASSHSQNVKMFLEAIDNLGIPGFDSSDLEKGSMKKVIECILRFRTQFSRCGSPHGDASKSGNESRPQQALRSPVMSGSPSAEITACESSTPMMHHVGHKFHEVFQVKQGRYADLSAAKISEIMKSNSLDNAPTQSLLSVVNGIIDESIERKSDEIPHRIACLLRKVVQEIERRILTQAEHLRTQNNLFKTREEKYQSRIRVLEALASGTGTENGVAAEQLQKLKIEKSKLEEKHKQEEEDMLKLKKETEQKANELSSLKQELQIIKRTHELRCLEVETEAKGATVSLKEDIAKLTKEKEQKCIELSTLKQELQILKKTHDLRCLQVETEAMGAKVSLEEEMIKLTNDNELKSKELSSLKEEYQLLKMKHEQQCLLVEKEAKGAKASLENKIKELENLLEASRNKVKALEESSESKLQRWNKKETLFSSLIEFQFGALQKLKLTSESIKHVLSKTQSMHLQDLNQLGIKFKSLVDATENYHLVVAENRKMFNELQDLKGNIRVYCRIRPFNSGQPEKRTVVEYIGDNGELVVVNPAKQSKDGRRLFRFNKVYGTEATQAEVYSDTQPLIRSILDGYSVCIFAYGQTGSGKTYTMSGPNGASKEEWGVNYRAINDLFHLSQKRTGSFIYEVGVQMVEIYNEQVRDLLSTDGSQRKLGILSIPQSNGLAVPDACMQPVTSTSDVLELMDIGLKNRAVGATALNERSSRSHSVVTVHVRGKDLQTGSSLHGNLHLVDLAGSERVDRSEVTGDRLKEAQHINKSLSALGDVIFALAQKSPHVPYRNSKLTQLLQSSLGGQAKTLMFVQINHDVASHSETMSTLKFAERVSGVELGAARSTKDGRDVRELMEQVASLKDTISRKDDEIEQLQLLKDLKHSGIRGVVGLAGKANSDSDIRSEKSWKLSEADSQKSSEDAGQHDRHLRQSNSSDGDRDRSPLSANLGYGDGDSEERLSDISDGDLSAGVEPENLEDEGSKQSDKNQVASRIRTLQRAAEATSRLASLSKDPTKGSTPSGLKKSHSSTLLKPPRRWQ